MVVVGCSLIFEVSSLCLGAMVNGKDSSVMNEIENGVSKSHGKHCHKFDQ